MSDRSHRAARIDGFPGVTTALGTLRIRGDLLLASFSSSELADALCAYIRFLNLLPSPILHSGTHQLTNALLAANATKSAAAAADTAAELAPVDTACPKESWFMRKLKSNTSEDFPEAPEDQLGQLERPHRDQPAWRRTVKTDSASYEANRITAVKVKREARKSQLPPPRSTRTTPSDVTPPASASSPNIGNQH
nr:unnamed protein product [Spirometra erinaceieuropaei]